VTLDFQNVADSGFTSGNALQDTYTSYLGKNPDWVFIFYGTNDAQHVEDVNGRTLVSLNEYGENIRAMVKALQKYTKARIVLITPPPIVDALANAAYGGLHIGYSTATVSQYADAVNGLARELALPCVDLITLFGVPPDEKYFGPDGLHPNLAGQMEIVRVVLAAIAS
jgi:lysophospholipase L1-like esterase